MNKFEQHIKQSLENFEAEYNPADWADMQNKLSKAKVAKSTSIGKGLMIAASVVAAGGLIYYFSTANTESKNAPSEPVNTQQVVVANETPAQSQGIVAEKTENNNTSAQVLTQNTQAGNDAGNTKSVADNKSTAPENTVQPVINNVAEKNTNVQEQLKEADVIAALPVQPSLFRASFRSDMNKVCEGASVKFIADNNDVPCTYKWYFGDGSSSSEQNPSHVFLEAGVYNVKLQVVSAKDKKQADQKNTITVLAAPSIRMNYSPSDDNKLHVDFEADADKVTEWKWSFGDRQTSSMQNPSHIYSKKGNYKVEVTAKNSAGCYAVVTKDLVLKNEINLLAPNAFSPDGNGVNDTWMPVALLNGDYAFTLTVSDKAGNIVFKTSDKNRSWEGQNAKTGDIFIWRAVVKDLNGEESNYVGSINIVE